MDIVRFDERAALNGWRVRMSSDYDPRLVGTGPPHVGWTGTIVPNRRARWIEQQRRSYKVLAVLFDEPIGCSSNVAYIGVEHLEIIGWEIED